MQRKLTPANNYHMIIRLIDDRPVLIIPKSQQNHPNCFQKLNSADSCAAPKQILTGVFQTAIQQPTSQPFRTHRKSFSCQINAFPTSNSTGRTEQTKYGDLKKTKDSVGIDKSKVSIISQHCAMNLGSETLTVKSEHFNGLESIQCIQSTSIHDGDSYDFDQADSEIISLTNEEKEFFQNFIHPQTQQSKDIQELFKRLSIQSIQPVTPKPSEGTALPQSKLKIIRNFFKPKEGIVIKDQRTCGNLQIWNEQATKSSKNNNMLNFLNQERKL